MVAYLLSLSAQDNVLPDMDAFFFFFQSGMIRLSSDTLFVHPIPDHLVKHVTDRKGTTPHLVYRKPSSQANCQTGTRVL